MERGWEPACHIYGLAWPGVTWPLCAACHPIQVGESILAKSWHRSESSERGEVWAFQWINSIMVATPSFSRKSATFLHPFSHERG
jgi:hypothetical protein